MSSIGECSCGWKLPSLEVFLKDERPQETTVVIHCPQCSRDWEQTAVSVELPAELEKKGYEN
jgi:hypothetical protein